METKNWNDAVFLVDANYIAYRGLYGLFQTTVTEIESAMFYGFMKTLVSIGKGVKVGKERVKSTNMILCWDSKHSYRKMLYPAYKRKPSNLSDHQEKILEAIRISFPRLREWMNRINIPSYIYAGYEADDVIAAFTKQFGAKFIVITRDEDLYQLLNRRVAIYKMVKKEKKLYTLGTFKDSYNITPNMWARVKAVGGCTSDNIPGVSGIGEKTAIKYVASGQYETSTRQYRKIKGAQKEINLFERLTRLPFDNKRFDTLSIEKKEPDWDAFTKFCQIYNFKSLIVKFKEVRNALS